VSAPVGITPQPANTRFLRWHRRILGFCLVIFAFELGLVLLIFPWLGNWDLNWLPLHSRFLASVWLNPYFRGALSGLGLLNIYVAVLEAGRQLAALVSRKTE
jgi:hypothetical protein